MARRRKKNLSRAQKIGIGLAAVAAVGGAAAVVVAMRRRAALPPTPPEDEGPDIVQTGFVPPTPTPPEYVDPLQHAKTRLCRSPNELTFDQKLILRDEVFMPIIISWPIQSSPAAPDGAAATVISQLCPRPSMRRPETTDIARQIAHLAWEAYTEG